MNASTAAIATAAFSAWWRPNNGSATSRYSPASPRIDTSWPPTATRDSSTSNASPSTASVDSVSSAASSSTSSAASGCFAVTTEAIGLMMPDFVRAISVMVVPRRAWWSRSIGVNTATCPSATLVESHSPPIPTSSTTTSTGASAKQAKASTVSVSKKVSGSSPAPSSSASTIATNGWISSQLRATASSAMGSPSMRIRSVNRSRCGLERRPVRRPEARSRLSIMRLVDVLPFVPVMWMTGAAWCGSPSSSTARRVGARRGRGEPSPMRASSAP